MDSTTSPAEVNASLQRQDVPFNLSSHLGSSSNHIITHGNVPTPAGLSSPICFRIRGIPPSWDSTILMEHLANDIDKELNENTAKLSGPFPSPFNNKQCALLNMDSCTPYLGARFLDPNAEIDSFVEVNGELFQMVIDRHFYDLTPMNKPSLPIKADVIAITGMGGHAFGSWRSRRRTARPIQRPMWIRDFLPGRFPKTRIMTYGYNCSLVRPNPARMMDYRQNFEDAILNARRDCKDRQIIFIGHSLGALLLIQLLIEWSNDPARNRLRDCIRGIFLFGAPHQGMEASDLYNLVEEDTDGKKCAAMLEQLQAGSEFLEQQQRSLARVSEYFKGRIYSFFETHKTQEVGPRIDQKAAGYVERVGRHSAQLCLPQERCIQVDSNHTDMVKLCSAEDRVFQTVVTGIKSCLVTSDNAESILSRLSWAWGEPNDGYDSLDQPQCIGNTIEVDDLKNSKTYFWLFHHADYKLWSEQEKGYKLLIVGGHKEFGPIISYHVQDMRDIIGSYSSLCCVYRSLPEDQLPTGQHAHMVWTLLQQAMHSCSQEQQRLICAGFLKYLVSPTNQNPPVELASSPTVTPRTILEASSPERLWLALEDAFKNVVEYRRKAEHSPRKGLQILRIILDINGIPGDEHWDAIEGIRRLVPQLQQTFDVIKVLVVDTPTNKSDIILQSSELCIRYTEYIEQREACLRSLVFHNTRYERISPHQEHTFGWLWQTKEYTSWNTNERADPGLLLIEGKPGSGKSTLMRYIKENIQPASRNTVISSFFYSARDGREESSHFNMLKVLLHQILEADESFFVYFLVYKRQVMGYPGGHWKLLDLQRILEDIFSNHPLPSTIYCILDAMDESDNTNRNRIEIIQHFDKLLGASQSNGMGPLLKIVLGSRPINELEDNLSGTISRISLQERTTMDIKRYTTARLEGKVFRKCDKALRDEFEDYILHTADGVFLWVRLVIDELEQKVRNGSRVNDLLALLKSLPKDLKSFYQHIVEELKAGRDARDLTDGGRILGFCLLFHRAIELGELCDALALLDTKEGDDPDPVGWVRGRSVNIRSYITHCAGGLVDIKDGRNGFAVAQLMHQTVREFLTSPPESLIATPFDITNFADVSFMISLMCVQFLEIMYEEMKPGGRGDPICPEYLEERPLLKYSLDHLMGNPESSEAKVKARLNNLVQKLEYDKESNAYMLLWRLTESERPVEIGERLEALVLTAAKHGHAMAIANLFAVGADKSCSGLVEGSFGGLLHHAAGGGHEAAVKVLLVKNAWPRGQDAMADSPMGMAVRGDHVGTIDLLFNDGVNLINDSDRRISLLEIAAANGRIASTRRLLKLEQDRGRVAFDERDRRNALHYACLGGYDDIVTELLQSGTKIWEKGHAGLDALSHAVIGGNETMIKKLLSLEDSLKIDYDEYIKLAGVYTNSSVVKLLEMKKAGATEPREMSSGGAENMQTGGPEKSDIAKLHIAAANDHYLVIYWLHERGVDLDTRDQDGSTALQVAARNNCADSCEWLVYLECEKSPRDTSGAAPIHLAVASNPTDLSAIQALVSMTGDVFPVDNNGKTPLHYAAKWGYVDMCEYLLSQRWRDKCADLDAADKNGKTALHYAAEAGSVGVCERLLKNGNKPVKTVDKDKSTPLHMAAMKGHLDVCMLLLRKNADRSAVNRNGSTASDMAFSAGFEDLARRISPEADIGSVSDSSESDPPYMEPDENLEGFYPFTSTGFFLGPAMHSTHSAIHGGPSEEQSETIIPHGPHPNLCIQIELPSHTQPVDDREATGSPAPRKRPAPRDESLDDLTEGTIPKRPRNNG